MEFFLFLRFLDIGCDIIIAIDMVFSVDLKLSSSNYFSALWVVALICVYTEGL